MKSMLKYVAAAVCAVALAACGGGPKNNLPVAPPQPDYKVTANVDGTGDRAAQSGDIVVFDYVGYLYDVKTGAKGDKVESSVDKNQPFSGTVGVGAMLTGWDQTLLGMKAGGTRTAILPANLAYGANAREALPPVNGNTYKPIPANQPLVYEFKMISVTPPKTIPNVPPSGKLEITPTTQGTGDVTANGKTLVVNYQLYLYDGTRANRRSALIDSKTDGSFSFVLGAGNVIKGWDQALLGQRVGTSLTVQVPPELGYGATPQLDANGAVRIPANSTLIFDLTIVSMK